MKPRLLLVEDDPTTRAFLHAATRALDVEIDLAASMQQALALSNTASYSAWLLDARLPDGSGRELLDTLRQSCPETPALAHTASADQAELQRLRDAGFTTAVSKPLPAADWQAAVRTLLESRAILSPAHVPSSPLPLWDDAAALKILGGNLDDLSALRGLFIQELPEQISALEQTASIPHHAAIQSELHRLRASCGFVGATRLAASIPAWPDEANSLQHILHVARETLAGAGVV